MATASTTAVRYPWQTPFSSDSVFNLPFGSGAQWTYNAQLAGGAPFVNTTATGWNTNFYEGVASDPLITVTVNGVRGGPTGTYQVHVPVGAVPASGTDNQIGIDDTTSHTLYSFGGFRLNGDGTATAEEGSAEPDYDDGLGGNSQNSNWDTVVGAITEHDLATGTIDHMLNIALPMTMLHSYSSTSTDVLAPNAWPQTSEDGFAISGNGGPAYTGTVDYGVTVGIPANVAEPSNIASDPGADMLWKALQDHGAMVRNSGGTGNEIVLTATQDADPNSPLLQSIDGSLGAQVWSNVQILANQGPNSVNGGGTPIVPLDPPLYDAPNGTPTPSPTPTPTPVPMATATEIFPGDGKSFTDSAGNVYTLSAQDVATENGSAIPGGQGTGAMELYNNLVYGQDASSGQWYTWNQQSWTSAAAPPAPTPTPTPTPNPTPSPTPSPTPTPTPTPPAGPVTSLHYAPNANLVNGVYAPGQDGFNLADVSSKSALDSLPAGVKGLVWIGTTNGADATFQAAVNQFAGDPNLYGFYLADEPDPTKVSAANLKAEADYVHAHVPGAETFVVLQNMGTPESPTYAGNFTPANTDVDLFGLDPYPVRSDLPGGFDTSVITKGVAAAEAAGIPQADIVPVYQAFGNEAPWVTPTADQENQILSTWGQATPTPAFDMAYSWGVQSGDQALVDLPDLQTVFAAHNGATSSPSPTPTPTPNPTPSPTPTTVEIFPGDGNSFTDGAGNVYTLASNDHAMENGANIPGGGGTGAMEYYNATVYGEDAKTGQWYTWDQHTWTSAAAPPQPTPAPTPTPTPITIPSDQQQTTVTQSGTAVVATGGNHMVFIQGSHDVVSLSGGNDTVNDSGSSNTYVVPQVGGGFETFATDVIGAGDTLDLRSMLSATSWDGASGDLGNFLHVANTPSGAFIGVSADGNPGQMQAVALLQTQTSPMTMSTLLAHAIT